MNLRKGLPWVAAVVSAGLLELPFPLAGPMPAWRGLIAFVGLVPLIWAVLSDVKHASGADASASLKTSFGLPARRPLRRAFLIGYLCGVLWYAGNCYWIYDTMQIHGGVPAIGSVGILLLYSLVLGGYFGLFGLGVRFVARWLGLSTALMAAPVLWTGLDFVAARFTSVPWDQLGYSQVDNPLLTHLAPLTGVYGITFFLVLVNAAIAGIVLQPQRTRFAGAILAPVGICVVWLFAQPGLPKATASAVLMQPNLDVDASGVWSSAVWTQQIGQFLHYAMRECGPDLTGIPETGAVVAGKSCGQPSLVAWPESPASYYEEENRFRDAMRVVAQTAHSPLVIGGVGMEAADDGEWRTFNSAIVFDVLGNRIGRYDKIHLVPFGEFVPYRDLFFFAKKLTHKVGETARGRSRNVFRIEDANGQAHKYGVFICYESVFADEVREFAKSGAEVFVNISDDGWYGDTSAPWQHLNMARMRAIENRRWILRDTNNGVTAVIDPNGTVRQSIPRHKVDALVAQFGYNSETTFYTEHGDVFAWLCTIGSIGLVAWSFSKRGGSQVLHKVRS